MHYKAKIIKIVVLLTEGQINRHIYRILNPETYTDSHLTVTCKKENNIVQNKMSTF